MKRTAKKLLTLALCLLLLGAVMIPAVAGQKPLHSDQILSVDMQKTGERTEQNNEIVRFTIVTTPAVKAMDFSNGQWEPYTTEMEFVGTTEDGNLIWQVERIFVEDWTENICICWDDEDGQRQVDFQTYTYEKEPAPAPQNLCRWCGKVHGGGFDQLIAWIHSLLARIFGARY